MTQYNDAVKAPDDGGPAFPNAWFGNQGMTLRDYFAAAAVTGLIASESVDLTRTNRDTAVVAYAQADAMLAARKQKAP